MDKLTLEILSAYLPHKLKWIFEGSDNVHEVIGLDIGINGLKIISPFGDYGSCNINDGKPILRPLSELIAPAHILNMGYRRISRNGGEAFTISQYKYLFENHFDIYDLIDKGLAVDVNSI